MSDLKVSKGIDGFTKIRLLPELEYNFSLSPLGTKLVKSGELTVVVYRLIQTGFVIFSFRTLSKA